MGKLHGFILDKLVFFKKKILFWVLYFFPEIDIVVLAYSFTTK